MRTRRNHVTPKTLQKQGKASPVVPKEELQPNVLCSGTEVNKSIHVML